MLWLIRRHDSHKMDILTLNCIIIIIIIDLCATAFTKVKALSHFAFLFFFFAHAFVCFDELHRTRENVPFYC